MTEERVRYETERDREGLDAIIAEVRRLAVGDLAPSRQRYDQQRDRALPTAHTIERRHGLRFSQVVEAAGLRQSTAAAAQVWRDRLTDRAAQMEAEIVYLLPLNRRLDREALEGGLPVLPGTLRVTEREIVHGGRVVRVRRESVSVR